MPSSRHSFRAIRPSQRDDVICFSHLKFESVCAGDTASIGSRTDRTVTAVSAAGGSGHSNRGIAPVSFRNPTKYSRFRSCGTQGYAVMTLHLKTWY